ncbi:MAG: hypothetical protein M3409_10955 [Gemmatimonadota bacterium]|jgi:Flp pilus assembly protein TadB|nr:hypothetical protein [Gemmatimonadota bacterium]
MRGGAAAAWIGFLALALGAQLLVVVVRARREGSVPLGSALLAIALAVVLVLRVRQRRREQAEERPESSDLR